MGKWFPLCFATLPNCSSADLSIVSQGLIIEVVLSLGIILKGMCVYFQTTKIKIGAPDKVMWSHCSWETVKQHEAHYQSKHLPNYVCSLIDRPILCMRCMWTRHSCAEEMQWSIRSNATSGHHFKDREPQMSGFIWHSKMFIWNFCSDQTWSLDCKTFVIYLYEGQIK